MALSSSSTFLAWPTLLATANGQSNRPSLPFRPCNEAPFSRSFTLGNHVCKRRRCLPAASAVKEEAVTAEARRFPFSETAVVRPTNVYAPGREWTSVDLGTAAAVAGIHGLALFAPFTFNWDAFWVAVELYVTTGLLGITLSYHWNLSHRSFKLPKLLEYLFAYCGLLSLQGNPIDWVSTHRHHHRLCETENDPHTPTEGFWQSHFGWLFDSRTLEEKCGGRTNVQDLESQAYYRFLEKTYILHPIALGAALYAVGGFPYVVWGMGVRTCAVYHAT